MIQDLKSLFDFILRHEYTYVFGNLGRRPHVVYKFLLEHLPGLNVAVSSPYYSFPSSGDQRIRTVDYSSSLKCDLLLFVEPVPYSRVMDKPEGVGRMVVFASHLMLPSHGQRPTMVTNFDCFSVVDLIDKTRKLISLQDGSMQTNNVNHIKPPSSYESSLHVQVIDGRNPVSLEPNAYVVVDLTHPPSAFKLYLSFLDAFDVMLRSVECVGRWVIAFPERHGIRQFEQLAQDVIDKLYCVKFEHGNVQSSSGSRNLNLLLSILPFYKSGVVDPQTFDVPTDTFFGIEYTAPETPEELFKAGTKFNLQHWVGSMYRIL